MNNNDLDRFITGNFGQDQYSDKCECNQCQEVNEIDDLVETTSGKLICEYCIDDYDICQCCEKPIDDDQSWDNENCDSCNESNADKDLNMER